MAFYDRVLDCDQIGHYFDDVDMPRLIDHQTKFIATVMGGPASYSDEALSRLHQTHQISRADFDRMRDLLRGTLGDFGVDPHDINVVMQQIDDKAHVIVSKITP